jgi:hypothetical protein
MMKKETWVARLGIVLVTITFTIGCGNTSDSQDNESSQAGTTSGNSDEPTGSNIPYLRTNHANYKEHGSNQTPAPVKDSAARSINWTIAATTQEGAKKLADHILFMERQLQADKNPRGWDKLFLMEAYMKYNQYYTTNIERSGTNVVVSKNANTACAYEVISAHSDAVSGDFFARGALMENYSFRAENILASAACADVRTSLGDYISSRQRSRGM